MTGPICVVLVLVCLVDLSWGYGTGAPSRACETMTPGHGSQQNAANPYAISLGAVSKYSEGVRVTVTITGTFQGILLQARLANASDTTPYGTFSVNPENNVKATGCSGKNNAVTHSSTTAKTNLMVTWTPPSEDVGTLEFVATVAEGKSAWWRNTRSAVLTWEAASNSTTDGGGPSSAASFTDTPVCLLMLSCVWATFQQRLL